MVVCNQFSDSFNLTECVQSSSSSNEFLIGFTLTFSLLFALAIAFVIVLAIKPKFRKQVRQAGGKAHQRLLDFKRGLRTDEKFSRKREKDPVAKIDSVTYETMVVPKDHKTSTSVSARTYDSVEGGGASILANESAIDFSESSSPTGRQLQDTNGRLSVGEILNREGYETIERVQKLSFDDDKQDILNREGYETIERVRVQSQAFSSSFDCEDEGPAVPLQKSDLPLPKIANNDREDGHGVSVNIERVYADDYYDNDELRMQVGLPPVERIQPYGDSRKSDEQSDTDHYSSIREQPNIHANPKEQDEYIYEDMSLN